ncbi:LacI family DNA-binding transcriptional regulator [Arthrobacter sp. AZCC_0090]|uniref:LacI family DNA-binding transcriptional regulator n=1 Tax=Arthrobacter sp. AZCC_0090 TaxID=2735881 RepID=UPI001615D163|nr:LacI family DNA-binding transcriptional regulator [Arthrobacter sp. AZCC_0090]MBB6405145.1 DNA-binding LacI/PurR family transcriptional regulator [Arthrobacter sp. AZCC_0090]
MSIKEKVARPATSLDVARLAGVSRTTVSSILNGDEARFPEATRDRVRVAAARLNYRPSSAGRSLVRGRSDTIVIALPNSTFGNNLQDAVDEVVALTQPYSGNVVVGFASATPSQTVAAMRALRPLAVLNFGALSSADTTALEDSGTIVVPAVRGTSSSQTISDGGIGQFQADALLQGGMRALWFAALSDSRPDPYGDVRFAALRAYCRDRQLPVPRRIDVPLTLEGSVGALRSVVSTGEPAGVVCFNDEVALAILAAAREMSVPVPDSISVIGVDHIAAGQFWAPRLTTVEIDIRGVVRDLAEELKERLAGGDPSPSESANLHFRLVQGGTT